MSARISMAIGGSTSGSYVFWFFADGWVLCNASRRRCVESVAGSLRLPVGFGESAVSRPGLWYVDV